MIFNASLSSFTNRFKIATLLIASVLAWFSTATIIGETMTPEADRLANIFTTPKYQSKTWLLDWPAAVAPMRGDLLSKLALVRLAAVDGADPSASTTQQQDLLMLAKRSASLAPHLSQTWVLIALLQSNAKRPGDAVRALKMSYLTAPADPELIPPRLRLFAANSSTLVDPELTNLVRGDIRLILTRRVELKDAITQAFVHGSAAGKIYIERTVGEFDPSIAASLR